MIKTLAAITALLLLTVLLLLGLMASTKPYQNPTSYHSASVSEMSQAVGTAQGAVFILDETEFNLALYFLIDRLIHRAPAMIGASLTPGQLEIKASMHAPLSLYTNITANFSPTGNRFTLTNLQIGDIQLPKTLLQPLQLRMERRFTQNPSSALIRKLQNNVQRFEVSTGLIKAHYQLSDSAGPALGNPEIRPAVKNKLQKLELLIQTGSDLSLSRVIPQLLTENASDPLLDNMTLIISLALHVADKRVTRLMNWQVNYGENVKRAKLTLLGREDLARHYLTAATIYLYAGSDISALTGLYKEMKDTRYSSAFDLADLAADRAGSRLAKLATEENAAELTQQRLLTLNNDLQLVPDTSLLSRGSLADVLLLGRSGLSSSTLREIEDELEALLNQLELYQIPKA
ncbi:MAG: hypothetical protein V7711_16625 [Pseudomonadales bacterium]